MKTSEGFRRARERVARGTEFICHALQGIPAQVKCARVISTRMGFGGKLCGSLDSWLEDWHGIDVFQVCLESYAEQMRLYRLRWLDSLIAEFEAKGD